MNTEKNSIVRRMQLRRLGQRRGDQRRSIHISVPLDKRTRPRRAGRSRRSLFRRIYPSRRKLEAEILTERRIDIISLYDNISGEKK
mgnify:CR=1 FL=1